MAETVGAPQPVSAKRPGPLFQRAGQGSLEALSLRVRQAAGAMPPPVTYPCMTCAAPTSPPRVLPTHTHINFLRANREFAADRELKTFSVRKLAGLLDWNKGVYKSEQTAQIAGVISQ